MKKCGFIILGSLVGNMILQAGGGQLSSLGLTLVDLTEPTGHTMVNDSMNTTYVESADAFNDDFIADTSKRALFNGFSGNVGNANVIYTFSEATLVNSYGIYAANSYVGTRSPRCWTVSGSNDGGETWTLLETVEDMPEWSLCEFRFFRFDNTTAYAKYKINFTGNYGNGYMQYGTMELYNVSDSDIQAADPVMTFGEGGYTSDYSSLACTLAYEIRPEATINAVTVLLGDSEDALSASTVQVSLENGVASFALEDLSQGAVKYWQIRFDLDYLGQTKSFISEVATAVVRSPYVWTGGTAAWLADGKWNISGYPSKVEDDVRIDNDDGVASAATLTLSTTMTFGNLTIDKGDSLKVTKNKNGSASASVLSLHNDGTLNVNGHAAGNAQNTTLAVNGEFVNNGVINVNGSGSRNRTTTTLSVNDSKYVNNGEIHVIQPTSDRNNATFEIKQVGEFENNGLISIEETGTYSGGSTYARINIGDSTANGTVTFSGTGTINIRELNRSNSLKDKPYITCSSYSTVVTNGPNHTIRGAGNLDRFSVANDGLILAEGTNLAMSVQNTYLDLGGTPMYNNSSGRMVAAGPAGMYLGANTDKNSRFINNGLLEARDGSFIALRTGLTEQTSKGTIATTVAAKFGGRWAGAGEFRLPRPVTLLANSVIDPGDHANGDGTGASTPGKLTFTNTLSLNESTVTELQCRKAVDGKYDAVWVEGNLTVAGTLRFTEKPAGGVYRIFGATGSLNCNLETLKVECAEGVPAPKLALAEVEYEVEETVLDESDNEVTQTVKKTGNCLTATWSGGLFIRVR